MDTNSTRAKLLAPDDDEKIAKAYFDKTGAFLDVLQIFYLKKEGWGERGGFELLESFDKEKTFAELSRGLAEYPPDGVFELPERIFDDDADVELNYTQRYLAPIFHRHAFFEIEYVLNGDCIHNVEGAVLYMSRGDVSVVPPNAAHAVVLQGESVVINLKIRRSTFDKLFTGNLDKDSALFEYFSGAIYGGDYSEYLYLKSGGDDFLEKLFLYIYTEQSEKKPHYDKVINGLVATLLAYLVQNYEKQMTLSPAKISQDSGAKYAAAENYIRNNYADVTLTSLAAKLYLSAPYLSAQFKKHTGKTFSAYLREVRLINAARLLSETNMRVESVCGAVGYGDSTQFIRSFKRKYGVTPKRYALNAKSDKT